ncbi:MAG: hypothetical protein GY861_06665 [bacterium]|nr:hypothetical protein [bacterium]
MSRPPEFEEYLFGGIQTRNSNSLCSRLVKTTRDFKIPMSESREKKIKMFEKALDMLEDQDGL